MKSDEGGGGKGGVWVDRTLFSAWQPRGSTCRNTRVGYSLLENCFLICGTSSNMKTQGASLKIIRMMPASRTLHQVQE